MNKQKKLKLILSSLKQKQLIKFFQLFLDATKCKFYKSIKQISFSCYESTCQVENFMVNGYGKTSSEALISGINNLIDCLVEEEQYCQAMRQCLKKFNVSPYGLTANGTTSKKQLLSTQKAMKTVAAETSMSLEKKVLTMSANLSSSSKNSSSKAKSIKEEIFEYFNLENLKVKNPNNQSFGSISPLGVSNKMLTQPSEPQIMEISKSKEKYSPTINQQSKHQIFKKQSVDKQLQQIYARIRQVHQQIQQRQIQNKQLKSQLQSKKKICQKSQQLQPTSKSNYFTRPSLENKQKKFPNAIQQSSQSSKKLTYLEMSLNDKLITKAENLISKKFCMDKQSESCFENVHLPMDKPKTTLKESNTKENVLKQTNENILKQSTQSITTDSLKQSSHHIQERQSLKKTQQRKCLIDISNIQTQACEPVQKQQQYSTYNILKHAANFTNPTFQTVTTPQQSTAKPINYPTKQQYMSSNIAEQTKKLRSLSVQNTFNTNHKNTYGTNTKNPLAILTGNSSNIGMTLNASFDNGSNSGQTCAIQQKKIKIPKLNLEILPNYHGKSNASLNQSLMENYEKKNSHIQINQANE